ncbi:response regulator [Azospirillum brasilense]
MVEDSPVVQQLLAHVIGEDPRLELAGIAASGEQALRMVDSLRPDVVSLDIRLPGIDGFAVTQRLMRTIPCPSSSSPPTCATWTSPCGRSRPGRWRWWKSRAAWPAPTIRPSPGISAPSSPS